MMNIREYFNNLYNNATTEEEWLAVMEQETAVYYEEEDLEEWARVHNVDLTAMADNEFTVLQYWGWDFEE